MTLRRTLFGSSIALGAMSLLLLKSRPLTAETPGVASAKATMRAPIPLDKESRMAWWREARFGMFIHWGIYSVPAGLFEGKPPAGPYHYQAEWLQSAGRIPAATYEKFAPQFNPQKFDADAWVKLAKQAGMKYIIFTAKHHDGFAMFKSAASPFNIVDATPYKRDPLADLAAACRKHGIKFGLYYSQNFDWHHKGGGGAEWDPAHQGDADAYVDKIVIPQLRELLSNYGEVSVLWWDIPGGVINKERSERILKVVHELAPNIIMNNRLGGGFEGDTETPEQHIPANGFPGRNWEVCMTMNNTWGYSSIDHEYKSTATLLQNLIDIETKGGNYLLNIGPNAEGVIPMPQVERLKEIGEWLKVYSHTVYGTRPSPLIKIPSWGRITYKGNTQYLHVFNWPEERQLIFPASNAVKNAHLVAAPRHKLPVTQTPLGTVISLPEKAPSSLDSVIALEIEGDVKAVAPLPVEPKADGSFELWAEDAELLSQSGENSAFFLEKSDNITNIGGWMNTSDYVRWRINVPKPGNYRVSLYYGTISEGNTFLIDAGGESMRGTLKSTGQWNIYKTESFGVLRVEQTGVTTVTFKPETIRQIALGNLRAIRLQPTD